MTYCSSYDVKVIAQITCNQLGFNTDGDYEGFIDDYIISGMEEFIDNYCGHDFNSHVGGTLTVDGTGKDYVVVPPDYSPWLSLGTVTIDGVTKTASDFKVYKRYIVYDDGVFTDDYQNVVLVGNYGYVSVPADIKIVCAMLGANMLREMVRSKMMPDVIAPILEASGNPSVLLTSPRVFTKELKEILEKYVFMQVDSR